MWSLCLLDERKTVSILCESGHGVYIERMFSLDNRFSLSEMCWSIVLFALVDHPCTKSRVNAL